MAAASQNLRIHAGQAYARRWRVGKAGVYWNLAGYSVRSQIRDEMGNLAVDLGTAPGVGIAVAGAANEWVVYTLTAELNVLAVGVDYTWDLWLTSPDGSFKEPILAGTVKVLKRVTQ